VSKTKLAKPEYTWRETPCVKCGRVYCPCPTPKEGK
jgi:hypothetical protein